MRQNPNPANLEGVPCSEDSPSSLNGSASLLGEYRCRLTLRKKVSFDNCKRDLLAVTSVKYSITAVGKATWQVMQEGRHHPTCTRPSHSPLWRRIRQIADRIRVCCIFPAFRYENQLLVCRIQDIFEEVDRGEYRASDAEMPIPFVPNQTSAHHQRWHLLYNQSRISTRLFTVPFIMLSMTDLPLSDLMGFRIQA